MRRVGAHFRDGTGNPSRAFRGRNSEAFSSDSRTRSRIVVRNGEPVLEHSIVVRIRSQKRRPATSRVE